MSRYDKYVGLEFAEKGRGPGYDCWGLVMQVLASEHDIGGLPDFRTEYHASFDRVSIPLLIADEKMRWKKVKKPLEGDLVVFRIGGQPMHVGFMISPEAFLHITRGINATIEPLLSPLWAKRIEGFYRHG